MNLDKYSKSKINDTCCEKIKYSSQCKKKKKCRWKNKACVYKSPRCTQRKYYETCIGDNLCEWSADQKCVHKKREKDKENISVLLSKYEKAIDDIKKISKIIDQILYDYPPKIIKNENDAQKQFGNTSSNTVMSMSLDRNYAKNAVPFCALPSFDTPARSADPRRPAKFQSPQRRRAFFGNNLSDNYNSQRTVPLNRWKPAAASYLDDTIKSEKTLDSNKTHPF
jgi:hypothetical protein